jgi:hypothetical protein
MGGQRWWPEIVLDLGSVGHGRAPADRIGAAAGARDLGGVEQGAGDQGAEDRGRSASKLEQLDAVPGQSLGDIGGDGGRSLGRSEQRPNFSLASWAAAAEARRDGGSRSSAGRRRPELRRGRRQPELGAAMAIGSEEGEREGKERESWVKCD